MLVITLAIRLSFSAAETQALNKGDVVFLHLALATSECSERVSVLVVKLPTSAWKLSKKKAKNSTVSSTVSRAPLKSVGCACQFVTSFSDKTLPKHRPSSTTTGTHLAR